MYPSAPERLLKPGRIAVASYGFSEWNRFPFQYTHVLSAAVCRHPFDGLTPRHNPGPFHESSKPRNGQGRRLHE
jgi:hypothetical protein